MVALSTKLVFPDLRVQLAIKDMKCQQKTAIALIHNLRRYEIACHE
jgi:hypothetical protein